MKNNRFAIEFTFPVYQNLRGIQMSNSLNSIIGWQYSFDVIHRSYEYVTFLL